MASLLLALIYLSFISLGLPDSLLGTAWPSMYVEFGVPLSYAGIVSLIVAVGTVISSLQCDRLLRRFGAGKITALSACVTAAAIFGFSVSRSFPMLCLFAVPYGLGAGCVDAGLNNYVALHYSGRHMSWLHCMWGVGTVVGPYLIGFGLDRGFSWNFGYRTVFLLQAILAVILLLSQPLWKSQAKQETDPTEKEGRALSLREVIRIRGAAESMLAFFCYCALEQTTMLWAGSYLVLQKDFSEETAAVAAGLFFIGITVGRGINGFLTVKFSDDGLIRLGQTLILLGILLLVLPLGNVLSFWGLFLIGLGCAPIYPCIIHSTPGHFGSEHSQAFVSVQIASAYIGTCLMPPLFGLLARKISVALLPLYLLILLAVMTVMHERLLKLLRKSLPR